MKVYIIGQNLRYLNAIHGAVATTNMHTCDLVMCTGGADINPSLYAETPHRLTKWDDARDKLETTELLLAVKLKKPILGICRGAQLGCVASGGKLIQHIEGQKFIHKVYDPIFGQYDVNSMHHQMMYPFNLPKEDYKLLAWAFGNLEVCEGMPTGVKTKPDIEPEIVYFPKTKILGVQGHPERADSPSEFRDAVTYYAKNLINATI